MPGAAGCVGVSREAVRLRDSGKGAASCVFELPWRARVRRCWCSPPSVGGDLLAVCADACRVGESIRRPPA